MSKICIVGIIEIRRFDMIYEKLAKIQSELKAPKGQYNSFGKYKYRSCEDILEAVKPLLIKHGMVLNISDEIVTIGDRYYVKATAYLKESDIESDNVITNTAYAREELEKKGQDGSQITGTASSYARKYCLNGLFLIDDTKDADNDERDEDELASENQIKILKDKMSDEQINKMLEYYKVNKIEELSIEQASEVIKSLNKKG